MKLETKFNIGDEVYEVYRGFAGMVGFSEKMTVFGVLAEVATRDKKIIYRTTYACIDEKNNTRDVVEESLCTSDEIKAIREGAMNDLIKYHTEQLKEAKRRKEELLNGK